MRPSGSTLAIRARLAEPSLAVLFWSFLRLGTTSFGGPSMVAYIRRKAVDQEHWLEEHSFLAGVALCQAIPGATAMQTAAYVGLRTRGLTGAAASFIGFGLPAFVFMMLVSTWYARAHSLPAVVSAFQGLQAVVVAIVANATLDFGRASLKSWRAVAIGVAAAAMFGMRLNPLAAILSAAFLGIMLGIHPFEMRRAAESLEVPRRARVLLLLAASAAIGYLALFFWHPRLFELAGLMSMVDLSAFGGGYASIPLMFHEIVDVRGWLDGPTFLNGIVLGQVTPGPIVITATFVGNLLHGPTGGLVATIAVFLPSFLLVAAIAPHFSRLLGSRHFAMAVGGILCSFVGLLLTVTVRFALSVPWDLERTLLSCAAFVALVLKIDILWVVLAGTVISLLLR